MTFTFKNALIALSAALSAIAPQAAMANTTNWIVVHNITGGTISRVNFAETWSTDWGNDFLGSAYIGPNNQYRFNVSSGSCVIDMRVHYTNNAEQTLRLDICRSSHVDSQVNGLSAN